ncbi:MAG: TIGR03435 family protein [Acidobacteriaceae bacterium]
MKKLLMGLGVFVLTMLVSVSTKAQAPPGVGSTPLAMDPTLAPGYDVATIKLSGPEQHGRGFNWRGRYLVVTNMTVQDIITFAYNIHPKQLIGGPAWMSQDRYDLDILPDHEGQPSLAQVRCIVQKLLADRLGMKSHEEIKELSAYVLSVGKTGPRITKSADDPRSPPGLGGPPGNYTVRNGSMAEFAQLMQGTLDRPVLDRTNLKGRYDFTLRWTPDDSQYGGRLQAQSNADDGAIVYTQPQLFTAIQEQLGLKLEAKRAAVNILVIDKIDRPSAN